MGNAVNRAKFNDWLLTAVLLHKPARFASERLKSTERFLCHSIVVCARPQRWAENAMS